MRKASLTLHRQGRTRFLTSDRREGASAVEDPGGTRHKPTQAYPRYVNRLFRRTERVHPGDSPPQQIAGKKVGLPIQRRGRLLHNRRHWSEKYGPDAHSRPCLIPDLA